MPDIDAFIVELLGIRSSLVNGIDALQRDQHGIATASQAIVLRAAVRDISNAIKAYRSSMPTGPMG